MKFKFCGDNDCQDWILAQIVLLSKLTLIKFKIILNTVIDNILKQSCDLTKINKITTELKFSEEDTRGMVAALNYIIINSTIYSVNEKTVCDELQQLGLPKEHSSTFCKLFAENVTKISEFLANNKVKNHLLTNMSFKILNCSNSPELPLNLECRSAEFTMKTSDALTEKINTFNIPLKMLDHLIAELHQAQDVINSLEDE